MIRIFSRPFRTSCENVGTPFPLLLRKAPQLSEVRARVCLPRSTLRVHEQKGRQTLRNYKVLRADASPRGELHLLKNRRGFHGFAGLAPHFGRSFRSRSVLLVPGSKDFPSPHQARRPLDNRASIGKTTTHVNPIHLWKSEAPFWCRLSQSATLQFYSHRKAKLSDGTQIAKDITAHVSHPRFRYTCSFSTTVRLIP